MNWEEQAKLVLKLELTRERVTYERLAERLQAMGIKETAKSIANKMSRGKFPLTFVLQCMKAIGVETLTIDLTTKQGAKTRTRQTDT